MTKLHARIVQIAPQPYLLLAVSQIRQVNQSPSICISLSVGINVLGIYPKDLVLCEPHWPFLPHNAMRKHGHCCYSVSVWGCPVFMLTPFNAERPNLT